MNSITWALTALGIWLAIFAFVFSILQYFNKKGGPKRRVLIRSFFISAIPSVLLYFIGDSLWVQDEEELFKIAYEKFSQEHNISDTLRVVPRSIPLPREIVEKLDMMDKAAKAGISFQPETYYHKGVLWYNSENFENAKKEFEIAVNLDSNMIKAHYGIGNSIFNLGKYEEAIASYNVALRMALKKQDTYFEACALNGLGLSNRNLNRIDDARLFHEKALKKFKTLNYKTGVARVINNLGLTSFSKKDTEIAYEYFKLALEMHQREGNRNGEVRALINMGLYFIRKRAFDKALEVYENAAKIAHDNEYFQGEAKAYLNSGAVYYRNKDFKKALEFGEKALKLSEKHDLVVVQARALTNIGLAYQQFNDHDKAIQHYLRALSLPVSESSYGFITKQLKSREDEEEIDVRSYRTGILLTIGYSYAAKGLQDSAIFYTEKIIQLDSTHAPAYANLAVFNLRMKNYKEAIPLLEKCIELDSTDASGYYNLACIYSIQREKEKAIRVLSLGKKYFSDELITKSKSDSDFDNIRRDPRFSKLMY